jgi:hypothetical protein
MGAADRVITHCTCFRIDAVLNEANKWVIKYLRACIEADLWSRRLRFAFAGSQVNLIATSRSGIETMSLQH